MVPRVNIFENAGFSFTCGRTKTEVFEYRGAVLIRSSMGKKRPFYRNRVKFHDLTAVKT